MGWPEWLSEARIAIVISLSSALFTGGTLIYTRVLARNDTKKMRRKALVVELSPFRNMVYREGWDDYDLIIRNLEPVGARVISIKSKPKGSSVIYSRNHQININGGLRLNDDLPEHQFDKIDLNISPNGTPKSLRGLAPDDTLRLHIMTKGVNKISDIEVAWEWLDGKKH